MISIRRLPKKVKNLPKDLRYKRNDKRYREECGKKAVLSYPPRHITIGVTSACNNKCMFCSYHGNDAKEKSNVYGLPFMLSYEDFVRMVDMAYKGGVPRVHVCGTGEPFLNPRILDMLDYVIKVYGKVSFQSNFWKKLYDEKGFLDEIVKRADKIECITTDILSCDPKEHEMIKNGASYEELLGQLEYLSKNGHISINAVCILTRSNHDNIVGLIKDIHDRGIEKFSIQIANLFSYDFSDYTSSENVYTSLDTDITEMLKELEEEGKKYGVTVFTTEPADSTTDMCDKIWEKFQTWPVKGCDEKKMSQNMIQLACAAVVRGEINSLGYLLDYDNIMDAWNNPTLVALREKMINGEYPSEWCKKCYLYHKEDGYYKQKVRNATIKE